MSGESQPVAPTDMHKILEVEPSPVADVGEKYPGVFIVKPRARKPVEPKKPDPAPSLTITAKLRKVRRFVEPMGPQPFPLQEPAMFFKTSGTEVEDPCIQKPTSVPTKVRSGTGIKRGRTPKGGVIHDMVQLNAICVQYSVLYHFFL